MACIDDLKSFEDCKLYAQTSRGWHDGNIHRRSVIDTKDAKIGDVSEVHINLAFYPDYVNVNEEAWIYHTIEDFGDGRVSCSFTTKIKTIDHFEDFESFKNSAYFEKMRSWGNGATDSASLRPKIETNINEDWEAIQSDGVDVRITSKASTYFKDWLGNTRRSASLTDFDMYINFEDSSIEFKYDDNHYEMSLERLDEILTKWKIIEATGIQVEDGIIYIGQK